MTAKDELVAHFKGDERDARTAVNYCRLMTQTMAKDIEMDLRDILDYLERSLEDGTITATEEEKKAIILVIRVIREECET